MWLLYPPRGGIYNTRGVGMVDGEHDVLGLIKIHHQGGDRISELVKMVTTALVITTTMATTKKKKSHDHEHQILLGGDLKFRMAFKPFLETHLMG